MHFQVGYLGTVGQRRRRPRDTHRGFAEIGDHKKEVNLTAQLRKPILEPSRTPTQKDSAHPSART